MEKCITCTIDLDKAGYYSKTLHVRIAMDYQYSYNSNRYIFI